MANSSSCERHRLCRDSCRDITGRLCDVNNHKVATEQIRTLWLAHCLLVLACSAHVPNTGDMLVSVFFYFHPCSSTYGPRRSSSSTGPSSTSRASSGCRSPSSARTTSRRPPTGSAPATLRRWRRRRSWNRGFGSCPGRGQTQKNFQGESAAARPMFFLPRLILNSLDSDLILNVFVQLDRQNVMMLFCCSWRAKAPAFVC